MRGLIATDKTSDYSGMAADVSRLKPKQKRVGLLDGTLWLDAAVAGLWGDVIKSAPTRILSIRFVQNGQDLNQCIEADGLSLTVQT